MGSGLSARPSALMMQDQIERARIGDHAQRDKIAKTDEGRRGKRRYNVQIDNENGWLKRHMEGFGEAGKKFVQPWLLS